MIKSFNASTFACLMLTLFTATGLFTSCTSAKKINYINDLSDSAIVHLPPMPIEERVIQKGDILEISFSARDEEAVKPFNNVPGMAQAGSGSSGGSTNPLGFTVAQDGNIQLPVIGLMNVVGITATVLKDTLVNRVKQFLNYPMVSVKFNSFRVTVLGEVRSPGTFNLVSDRKTIFEAIAAGGDLPTSAKKYNLEIIRDYNGVRTVNKLNLTRSAMLTNPTLYQVKPNDIIYVRTRPSSVFREDFQFVSSVITIVVTLATLGITLSK